MTLVQLSLLTLFNALCWFVWAAYRTIRDDRIRRDRDERAERLKREWLEAQKRRETMANFDIEAFLERSGVEKR